MKRQIATIAVMKTAFAAFLLVALACAVIALIMSVSSATQTATTARETFDNEPAAVAFADDETYVIVSSETSTEEDTTATAEETSTESGLSKDAAKAIGASLAIGIAASCAAIGMAIAIGKTNDSIARQPEMEGKLRSNMMLGLVFIETVVIYALIVGILVVFVL